MPFNNARQSLESELRLPEPYQLTIQGAFNHFAKHGMGNRRSGRIAAQCKQLKRGQPIDFLAVQLKKVCGGVDSAGASAYGLVKHGKAG